MNYYKRFICNTYGPSHSSNFQSGRIWRLVRCTGDVSFAHYDADSSDTFVRYVSYEIHSGCNCRGRCRINRPHVRLTDRKGRNRRGGRLNEPKPAHTQSQLATTVLRESCKGAGGSTRGASPNLSIALILGARLKNPPRTKPSYGTTTVCHIYIIEIVIITTT